MKIISVRRRNIQSNEWEIGPPIVEAVGKKLSRTLTETEYHWCLDGYFYRLIISAGYLFDGASIPRVAWTLLGLVPHGAMDMPALPHDFIYERQGIMKPGTYFIWNTYSFQWHECSVNISRETSDKLLHALCRFPLTASRKESPANIVQTHGVYCAVRLFGRFAWKRDDEKRKMEQIDVLIKEAV